MELQAQRFTSVADSFNCLRVFYALNQNQNTFQIAKSCLTRLAISFETMPTYGWSDLSNFAFRQILMPFYATVFKITDSNTAILFNLIHGSFDLLCPQLGILSARAAGRHFKQVFAQAADFDTLLPLKVLASTIVLSAATQLVRTVVPIVVAKQISDKRGHPITYRKIAELKALTFISQTILSLFMAKLLP